ncbi:hypothetical protein OGATHE_005910 [Ogataea polymorpha]|uniref:Small-subunit processome Utp12 domain-containing protein n=1 Tax=Ogataea polymorpha TaxID=460523 RepID=A0A9P8NUA4_9ASCO|nr:hypothetical protein OGATHE_005910 [Ogataea polymorpha]
MSLVASAFDATGQYYASVSVSLDSHTLRVQSSKDMADNFSNVYPFEKGVKIRALTWIQTLSEASTNVKKRRVDASLEDQLIALCLENGAVHIYSPSRNELVHKLATPNHITVSDFHHNAHSNVAYCCDIQGNLYEFNLKTWELSKTHRPLSEETTLTRLATVVYNDQPHLVLCSHSTYLVNSADNFAVVKTLPGHVSPIQTVLNYGDDIIFTAAQGDRFINAISVSKGTTVGVLVAEEPVISIAIADNGFDMTILAATTESGAVEIFNSPLQEQKKTVESASSPYKRKKKSVNTHKSDAKITVARPASEVAENLPIQGIFSGPKHLTLSWLEDSSVPFFNALDWWVLAEDGTKIYKLVGDFKLEKPKPNLKFSQFSKNGHDIAAPKTYNESNAVVSSGDNFRDLETAEEDDEDEISLAERLRAIQTNGHGNSTEKSGRASTGTLTTVLSQALKSNDHSLLESVLNNKDESVIRNTILKLDSIYVGPLLDRLAEKIARNTNRQTNLAYWIKHILIFHGGSLQNSPSLNLLATTMKRKAGNLDRLLELRGKLSMMTDRFELKRELVGLETRDDDEEEADVEYIEELDDAGLLSSDEDEEDEEDEQEGDDVDGTVLSEDASDDQHSDLEVESNGRKIDLSDPEESS